jgi:FkbM family methyltransferase
MINFIDISLQKIKKLFLYIQKFGWISGINIIKSLLLASTKNSLINVSLPGLKYSFKIRKYTSDILVFNQIFLEDMYDLPICKKPKLIIDGGAYVGFSTIFFANKYPEAKIIAVEPNVSNFALLKENTLRYHNIELINSALWNKNSWVNVINADHGLWRSMVEEASHDQKKLFESVTIGNLLRTSGHKRIDILKLDVEGSEKSIFFEGYEEWLDKVGVIIIELHDRYFPGCSEAFYNAINKYNFIIFEKGESTIALRNDL